MKDCPSCHKPVSPSAAACPGCGHPFRSPGGLNLRDPIHLVGLVLAVLFLGVAVYFAWVMVN